MRRCMKRMSGRHWHWPSDVTQARFAFSVHHGTRISYWCSVRLQDFVWRNVLLSCADGCSPVQPVTVALRHFSVGVDPIAAHWDFNLLDGHGGWRADGCHITGSGHNTTSVRCAQQHSNIAVLMVTILSLSWVLWRSLFECPVHLVKSECIQRCCCCCCIFWVNETRWE